MKHLLILLLVVNFNACLSKQQLEIDWIDSLTSTVGESSNITISLSQKSDDSITLFVNSTHFHSNSGSLPIVYPHIVEIDKNTTSGNLFIQTKEVGQIVLQISTNHSNVSLPENSKIHIAVIHSNSLYLFNIVIGWIYFAAWSISFYPQTILNFQRKSVVGLNFDFLAYNIVGFVAYGLYNIGMFWIPVVKEEYLSLNPDGINPVQLNDVCFTLHAILITCITIIQCFIYEKGGQKVSKIATILISISLVGIFVLLIVAICDKITWLTYLMSFSYLKIAISLIKYIPQAYMNYRRKSTEGWSIGNVLLDFTGGLLSILQMILQSYNNNEWTLIFGDPTKFALGLISVLFDIFFIIQHYVLYKTNKYSSLPSITDSDEV